MFISSKKIANKISVQSTQLIKKSIFGLTSLSLAFGGLTTLAQNTGSLGIMPTTSDPNNSQTKTWFLEKVEAGSSVSRAVNVLNFYKEDKEVEVRAKDNIQTRDGSWDFKDNAVKDEFLGSWVKLEKDKVSVPAGKNTEAKFTINVPSDAKPGEYGGVVAVQLPTIADNQGVAIENRVGSRIYLTVPGDLKMAVKMDKFEFLSPKSVNYSQSTSDKVAMQLNFENVGNIFTKSFGKVQITTPSGTVEQVVDKDLAPREKPFLFNFTTNESWQVGKYKAKIELNNRPIINNKGELVDSSPAKILETEFDMTQEISSAIKRDRQNPAQAVQQNTSTGNKTFAIGDEQITASVSSQPAPVTSQSSSQTVETKKEEKADYMPILLAGVGVLALIIIVLLVFLLKKKGTKEEVKVETKTETVEKSTEPKKE
jgi:Bacterial protein of unknown function (DUF916)